jgi:putative hydroxymethylpyrimidine transport system substrate-binding protein
MNGTRARLLRSQQLRLVLALAIIAMTLLAAACGSSTSSTQSAQPSASGSPATLTTIRMVEEWPVADAFWIPWIVAKTNGYYQAAGINLQIIPPPNTAAVAQFIGTGRADLAFDTTMDVVFARAQGAPMVSIAAYGHGNNWGLISLKNKPLNFSQAKGKTIGTYTDAWSKGQLQIMLQSEGLALSDVKLITASSDTVPLLMQHKVDAITGVTNAEGSEMASLGVPNYSIVLAKDHGVPDSPIWVLAANSQWLAKNQALAQKWMNATIQGWQYAIDHPQEAVKDFETMFPKAETVAFATQQWKDTMPLFGAKVTPQSLAQTDATWRALLVAAKHFNVVSKVEQPSAYYTNQLLGQ